MKHFLQIYKHSLLFTGLFLAIALYYNFHEIFHYSPRSTHQWRQADSASITLSYYENGMHFFKPRMHHIMGGEGYVTGAGEAPVFYYFVAVFYSIFGAHDGIFRLLSLLTFLLGLFLISKILWKETEDLFAALAVPAIIMASPVVAYYSFNFTPNIPAQGLALIAIWFFYLFYKKRKYRFFYWSMIFFSIAGVIKVSSLIGFVVILAIYGLEFLNLFKFNKGQKIFANRWKALPGFLMVFLGLFLWKSYADYYNDLHSTAYFLSRIRPIWDLDEATRNYVFNNTLNKWFAAYFHPFTFWLISALGSIILLTPRRQSSVLYFSLILIFIGCFSFFMLWFQQFEHHDYYAMELILLPLTILMMFFLFLKKHLPFVLKSWIFRTVLVAGIAYNIYYARTHLEYRYDPESVFMSYFNPTLYKTNEVQHWLKSLGIQYPEKVVSAPDQSPNNSLYHLNLMGWTELYLNRSMDANRVKALAKAGANYLIISDKKYLEHEDLKTALTYPLGNFENSIFAFDIRPFKSE